jgi:hypothetical protein
MTTFNCIPNEILAKQVGPYLTEQDLGQLALVRSRVVREIRYSDRIEPLRKEIQAEVERTALAANEVLQRLLVSLITLPDDVNPRYYRRLMPNVMVLTAIADIALGPIQHHASVARLITTSSLPISPYQIRRFCSYLGATYILSQIDPWVGGRSLEQYPLPPEERELVLREYLSSQARRYVTTFSGTFRLNREESLNFKKIHIVPSSWFDPNYAGAQISELLLEVLWNRIRDLRDKHRDEPIIVIMTGSADRVLPLNFTLPLARRITDANIYLVHGGDTIDVRQIAETKRKYALNTLNLTRVEKTELAERYPRAVEVDNS